jgi:hypothetical protein
MGNADKIASANVLAQRGQYEEAAELLAELLRREPRNIQAHYALAQVRIKQGHKDWADSLLRRAGWLEQVLTRDTESVGFLQGAENSDLAYAQAVESEILTVAREFDEWEHDHPNPEPGQTAFNLEDGVSALLTDSACQPAEEAESESNPTTEAVTLPLREEQDNGPDLAERPMLSLSSNRSWSEEGDHAEGTPNGPTIIWKGRRHAAQHEAEAVSGAGEDEGVIVHPATESAVCHESLGGSDAVIPDQEADDEDMADLFSFLDLLHGRHTDLEDEPEVWQEEDSEFGTEGEPLLPDEERRQVYDTQSEDAFSWSDIEVDFSEIDDEEAAYVADDAETGTEPNLPGIPERIELWRRTEQLVLELLRETGRLDNPSRARYELSILTRVLLEGAVGASRPDISVNIRSRHLRKMLVKDVSVDDIAAAHACRQAWAENPELHIDLGGFVRGEGWARKEEVRHLFPWSMALRMAELFRATEIEEFRYIFASMYERWSDKRSLQRQFPLFRLYVHFRLRPAGLELDRFPLGVFDEPEGVDLVERWEDDPVQGVTFRQALESYGLMPDLYRTFLDLPVLKRNEEGDANNAQWC